ncbi:hypothetical protein C8R43DRAFT_1079587 [Mycena crocata]|nr:hypothetical protein C8R43DRAFT_1079587 [Mycena crocata]
MSLDTLPDEILQRVFFDLGDPSALTRANRRLYAFSQDPYVRAHYFLARYGHIEALYFALGRGKLITPRVLDILLASGAHFSRYLVQVAFHHFFHSQSHFIKPSVPWARHVELGAFCYLMSLAADKYGDIPRGKNEDDGALFTTFIKEAKLPPESQRVSWEVIRDIFENYHFIPFCSRDPLMAQFPLALAIEPRLLPFAVANGFQMDAKYRDFVFRKMFERSSANAHAHAEEIVANVRELCRLDPDMFVTRTVAAEVCLEAKSNEAAYSALKQLDRSGDLPFALADLVRDVIKLFLKARAITMAPTAQILAQLYTDFLAPPSVRITSTSRNLNPRVGAAPLAASVDPTVRRAMLLTVFSAEPPVHTSAISARLAALRLGPFTLKDAEEVLVSAFVEKHTPVADYLRREGVPAEDGGMRKVTHGELRTLAENVAVRCLTHDSKGKTLKRLHEAYPSVKRRIVQAVLEDHVVNMEALAKGDGSASLAQHMGGIVSGEGDGSQSEREAANEADEDDEDEDDDMSSISEEIESDVKPVDTNGKNLDRDLGGIGFEPLSAMIRRDEMQGGRGRRRYYPLLYSTANSSSRLPQDPTSVAQWIRNEFGTSSSVTATFITHAIINGNNSVLNNYLHPPIATAHGPVPVTFKHFQILAQLGSATVDYYMYERIKQGAPFYATEEDYLTGSDSARFMLRNMKLGTGKAKSGGTPTRVKMEPVDALAGSPSGRGKKRPRRSAAAAVNSYAVPDSDDEAIAAEEDREDEFAEYRMGGGAKKKAIKVETSLERWIKALSELLKEEQQKYREKKKRMEKEKAAEPGAKIRMSKSDFFRSLTTNLRCLRELDAEKRMFRAAEGEVQDSDAEDDEYVQQKASRAKRRRTTA